MRRRALLMGGKGRLPLVLEIDTTKPGVTPSNGFQIPANATGETYLYRVDWGDGTKTEGHTGIASHTYATGGIYQVKIYGRFPRMYFNNGGDRQKLLKVLDWGEINYSTNQTSAFWGCVNLEFIATDTLNAWYNNIVLGNNMFLNSNLTSLPDGMTLESLTNGGSMFRDNSLTFLPDGMTLDNLTNGSHMFRDNSLTSLPDGMVLANLTNGTYMFRDNSLTSLPSGMTLDNLTNGTNMFNGNSLTSLPSGMALDNLTNGFYMFAYNSSLTELPDNLTLETLESGEGMFRGVPLIKVLNIRLYNIQGNANLFMSGANLPNYSEILIDIEANNPNDNVTIHFGSSKYNSSAVTARANLIARDWTITDGGLE